MIKLLDLLKEMTVKNPSLDRILILNRVKHIYPEAHLMIKCFDEEEKDNWIIYFYKNENGKNVIIYDDKTKQYTVYIKDDLGGRRFKNLNNMIKYIKNNK
jgi:hypothetical protein